MINKCMKIISASAGFLGAFTCIAMDRPLPHYKMPVMSLEHGTPINGGDYAFLRAAALGDCDSIVKLLQGGVDVNVFDNHHNTPLHLAAANGHLEVVRTLIAHGAYLNETNDTYETALSMAVENQHVAVVSELVGRGALPDTYDFGGWTPLHDAVNGDYRDIMRTLLAAGADVNELTNPQSEAFPNMTPLQMAIRNNNPQLIRELIWWGASHTEAERPAIIRVLEKHPLMLAAARGRLDVVADYVATNATSVSELVEALIFALGQGQTEIVDFLTTAIWQRAGSEVLQGHPLNHIRALLSRRNLSWQQYAEYYAPYEIVMFLAFPPQRRESAQSIREPENNSNRAPILDPRLHHPFYHSVTRP